LLRQVLYSVRSERMLATTTRKPLTIGLVDSEGDSDAAAAGRQYVYLSRGGVLSLKFLENGVGHKKPASRRPVATAGMGYHPGETR
jgi:hypothetical protein